MNTPKFVLLLLLFSVITIEGAFAKADTNTSKAPGAMENTVVEETQRQANLAIISKPLSVTIPKIDKVLSVSNAPQQTLAVAVASPIMTDLFADGFGQGLFYGVVFLLILINFISFLLFDERIYLVYGSSLIALAGFLFYSDGLLAFFDMQMLHNAEIVKASFYLVAAIASVIFGSYFLNINATYPRLKFTATGIFSAAAIVLISGWFLETEILAVASNILSSAVVLTYFVMGVVLFSKKNYAKLYVVAMAFPVLFTLDYLLAVPFNFAFLNIELSHIKGAVLVQILMLTYGILYRMREIKEENLIKQTELKIFLKKQEMTAREKTEKHIEDVYLENVIMQYDLDGFEIKLLQYISEGKTNETIARRLKLSEKELEEVTNELYQKLEIREHIKEDYRILETQPDFIYN